MSTTRDPGRMFHVTIAVYVKDGADIDEVMQEMTYSLDHPGILDCELIDMETDL